MKVPITAFFSCSFRDTDKSVNDLIRALCEGLGIDCRNLDGGDSNVPPEAARRMIQQSEVFIAVAVARDQIASSGSFSMPGAVRDEIGIAYGLTKPMLLIREKSVSADGFTANYCTHLEFKREEIQGPAFLQRVVHSIQALASAAREIGPQRAATEYYAEKVSHALSLEKRGNEFVWRHSTQRRVVFTRSREKPLTIYRWNDTANQGAADGQKPINVTFELIAASRKCKMTPTLTKLSPFGVDAQLAFAPTPVAGDSIEYYVCFEGPRLCNSFLDEADPEQAVTIAGRHMALYEGIYFVNHAREFEIEFSFARAYGLSLDDVAFFAGQYSNRLDTLDESEIARASIEKYLAGGDVRIRATVKNPQLAYMYGLAWVPPVRSAEVGTAPNDQ